MGQDENAALPERESGDNSAKNAGVSSKRERDGAVGKEKDARLKPGAT